MKYVLETNEVCKYYGDVKALQNVSLHIPKGAIYGCIGRNGAGKTTLIRLLCGLQNPTKGSFTLFGSSNRDRDFMRTRRRIGAVVETPSIYQDMSAEDNLKQQYLITGLPSFDGLHDILSLVGLADTRKKKVKNFSLGMRQRLGIAIALVGNPDFLILDEPVNGLDPQGIIEIRELILRLNQQQQITFLISSHYLDELSKLATHYGFLDHGCLVKEMSAEELQAACKKCVRIKVTNMKAVVRLFDEWQIDYKILSDAEVDAFGEIKVTQLALALAEMDCEIISIREQDETLESYFISLVGGGIYA